ncbi:hypothetical protein NIIDMKKI_42130 [Mycobacterium kansasii]|uniref:Glycoside hydrolase family 65 N-terminal domain-containing protein n=1 Tax=Mycobacterium kansasii TaxID=1768 RepID=A0A7G1IDJ6_MYCKA|nr:hypothetical protein NIIDMKKI_42130 [Mycobacterium kansasii]
MRFSGIGVVVRHDRDGDRPTAASFTLTSPTEARDFVRRGARWLAYDRETRARGWTFTWEGYDPPNEKLREALCTVGNGYFATRGLLPNPRPAKSITREPMPPVCTTGSMIWSRVPGLRTRAW